MCLALQFRLQSTHEVFRPISSEKIAVNPLGEIETRVLAVMIEKSLTQPNAYPMTINSIVLAANQKQNREPVVEYSESQVATALGELIKRQLVVQAPPEYGARANRFAHRVVEMLRWDRREQALMAELMLRGRQTAGELRTRASRMTPFADLAAVLTTLDQLRKYSPPYVQELAREPGRSANRFRHLLTAESRNESETRAAPAPLPQHEPVPSTVESIGTALELRYDDLEQRVSHLETEVGELRRLVEGGTGS